LNVIASDLVPAVPHLKVSSVFLSITYTIAYSIAYSIAYLIECSKHVLLHDYGCAFRPVMHTCI
jgi:hypothetical protein